MLRIIIILLFSVAINSLASQTTVYKCVIDGVATFSQTPCERNAKQIKVSTPPRNKKAIPVSLGEQSVEVYLLIKKIDQRIHDNQVEINTLQQQRTEQLKSLTYMTQDGANRLGASSISAAIEQQSQQIKERFEMRIAQYKKQNEQLLAHKSTLQSQ